MAVVEYAYSKSGIYSELITSVIILIRFTSTVSNCTYLAGINNVFFYFIIHSDNSAIIYLEYSKTTLKIYNQLEFVLFF